MNVTVEVPHYAEPGEYLVRLVGSNAGETREGLTKLIVTPKIVAAAQLPPIPANEPSLRNPDNLYYRDGGVHFGYICVNEPSECRNSNVELWLDPTSLNRGPRAAMTVRDAWRMYELSGWKKFQAKNGTRIETEARAFQKARRALRAGRTLRGVMIVRSGNKPMQIRRVVIRIKRHK
jgi:hypothetical protein